MIQEGMKAPDFTLQSGEGHTVSLSDFIGKKVILYFYPRDNTPGCTTEACEFRDTHDDYQNSGAVVIGVSPDTVSSHKKFSGSHDLPFILLADPEKEVIRLYEAEKEKNMYGKMVMGVQRSTFVIDEEGTILKIFPKVKAEGHAREVLAFIDSL
jgi:thioredoxin-dependent peroxiredoxin